MQKLLMILACLVLLPAGAGTKTLDREQFSLARLAEAKVICLDFRMQGGEPALRLTPMCFWYSESSLGDGLAPSTVETH